MAAYETIAYAVRHRLRNTAGVSALTTRIYPFATSQNPTHPFILYHTVEDQPFDDIKGSGGLFRAHIQLDIYAKSHDESWQLAEEVRKSLMGYAGTHLTVNILGITLEPQFDAFEEEINDYRVISPVKAWYKRTGVPT